MPNYIVLRLIPPAATDAATFTTYLNNLTISVYDVSYTNPAEGGTPPPGALIGSAAFAANQIVQHLTPPLMTPPLESVATAIIQYNGPPSGAEYITPDLRIEFDRPGAPPVFDPRIYYDVQ